MICPACNNDSHFIEKIGTPPHEAGIWCGECDRFIRWKSKDKNNGKRPKNKYLPADLGINFCQLCLRPKNRLGKHETLTSHHVIEINTGGPDLPGNIWVVCSHCHALVGHVRTYMNDHFGDLWEKYEEMKSAIEEKELTPEEYEDKIIDNLKDLEKPPWE